MNTGYTLPIAKYNAPTSTQPQTVASVTGQTATGNTPSFAEITKLLEGGHHHHHGGSGGSTKSLFDQDGSSESTDAFGVSNSGSSPSVDAFGAASSTPSSTASLTSAISDPFSSIASNFSIQAQLNSQQLLNL